MAIPGKNFLTHREVEEIKRLLWSSDHSLGYIAGLYSTSYSSISRIFHGKTWEKIKWPDGSTGCCPSRHKEPSPLALDAAEKVSQLLADKA